MAIKKVINSSTQQFEPVLVDKLVLDAVPTVNSFNSVTSDAVARAVAGASGEVPQVTESDNGKVLKAIYDAGGPAVEWGSEPTVDQTYDASSENAQSGVAVAEAVTSVDKVSTSQASATEIDIAVKGNAPIKLIAEDYGSIPGPSTTLSFKSATFVPPPGGGASLQGINIVFDLPASQALPISARITVNQDIVGSDTRYSFGNVVFSAAINDLVTGSGVAPVSVTSMISSSTTLAAGNYDVALTMGDPTASFSQVGFSIMGQGLDEAWTAIVNYIIDNASTLFTVTVPTTVKSARLLPAASSNDVSKVLTVSVSGKPGWATPPTVPVDQTYDALSENPQSGVAVAEAVGTPVNLVQGSGITLTESSGNVTISADAQLPAFSDADSGKVLQVQADGTLAWVTLS